MPAEEVTDYMEAQWAEMVAGGRSEVNPISK
jgi:hypothetical protein